MVSVVGSACGDVGDAAVSVPSNTEAPAANLRKLPWRKPTLTEISFDDLPTELRKLALGLPVNGTASLSAPGTA